MAYFTETTKHITINEHGTPILAETRTNIVPVGLAHEGGVSEEKLLEQYGMSRAQLHAALSYFYEHRDEIRAYEAETDRLMTEHGVSIHDKIEEMRRRL